MPEVTVSDRPLSTFNSGYTYVIEPALTTIAHTMSAACNGFVGTFSCSSRHTTTQWLECYRPCMESVACIQDEPSAEDLWLVADCDTHIFIAAGSATISARFEAEGSRSMLTGRLDVKANVLSICRAALAVESVS